MYNRSWAYVAAAIGLSVMATNVNAGPLHGMSTPLFHGLIGNAVKRTRNTCLAPQSLHCRSNARSARRRCLKSGTPKPTCNIRYFRSLSRCIAECSPGPSGLQAN